MHDRTVALHGQRFHYTDWGSPGAPAVVMLHGITGHARTWDEEARLLAERFHVLALDQRGHGDSDPAPDGDYSDAALLGDLGAFAEALQLRRFSIVALSLGGRVAINFAGHHPDRIERLVIVDIGPEIAPGGRARVGTLMATAPERFATVDDVVAHLRTNAPLYTEALLRHRAEHAVRPLPGGGFTWKYDRALRDGIRQGRVRVPADLWPSGARSPAPPCSCAAPSPTSCPTRPPSGWWTSSRRPASSSFPARVTRCPATSPPPSSPCCATS